MDSDHVYRVDCAAGDHFDQRRTGSGVAADADCASSSGANGRDQRGVARPQGIRCDIGAVESDLPPACASPFGDVAQADEIE